MALQLRGRLVGIQGAVCPESGEVRIDTVKHAAEGVVVKGIVPAGALDVGLAVLGGRLPLVALNPHAGAEQRVGASM